MPRTFTLSPNPATSTRFSRSQAATQLGTSSGSVDKMLAQHVIPDLQTGNVITLASRQIVTATSSPVTLIRLGVPDRDSSGRKIGFDISYTDAELLEASRKWWVSNHTQVVQDRLALIVVGGGFIAGALDISGLQGSRQTSLAGGKLMIRHAYEATLVARIDDFLDMKSRRNINNNASSNLMGILGHRAPNIGGGPVIRY